MTRESKLGFGINSSVPRTLDRQACLYIHTYIHTCIFMHIKHTRHMVPGPTRCAPLQRCGRRIGRHAQACLYIHTCMNTYVYVYVCMYVCMYRYTCIFMHIQHTRHMVPTLTRCAPLQRCGRRIGRQHRRRCEGLHCYKCVCVCVCHC